MRRRTPFSILVPALMAGCAGAVSPPVVAPGPTPGAAVEQAVATISEADARQRIAFLAGDELRGRDTPSPGLEAAATWAANQFREFGLQPAGDAGTFIQRFPFDASRLDLGGVVVESRASNGPRRFTFATDYFAIPARIDSVAGVPLYLGTARPGILAPPQAAGRPLMFFVPDTATSAWQVTAGAALQAAMAGRAGAVVLVLDPEFSATTLAALADQLASQILPVPMPVIGMRYQAAQAMFEQAGRTLDRAATEPVSVDGVSLLIRTPVGGSTVEVPNIVALLPGSDSLLSREYIVFSAHIDHVGVGSPDADGDSIYNGADDDASGTTAVLEIAQAFASLERRPARSLLFLLVSGEEKGLLGSDFFAENPTVPLSQIVANINIDMIGRNAPDTVVAIGQDYSSLGPSIQAVAAAHSDLGLTVAPDLWPEEQLFFRSDHFSFAVREVPAIFFTTGLHDDYHRPSDEPETIDYEKLTRVARLLFRFGYELATTQGRPQWTPEGLAEVRKAAGGN